jgi:hypothetical protein
VNIPGAWKCAVCQWVQRDEPQRPNCRRCDGGGNMQPYTWKQEAERLSSRLKEIDQASEGLVRTVPEADHHVVIDELRTVALECGNLRERLRDMMNQRDSWRLAAILAVVSATVQFLLRWHR